ncbi:hypothetical protein Bca52824_040637 [Brassica carinata]|uniref:Transport inhibitor response 1 domain-containing protein n=1 Tax=Brassica carinata TaxID=52824 RepID=A0A8X7RTT5_BRACI|nr:hypothetical protein Bca52824_040637 [Brassica carinata]
MILPTSISPIRSSLELFDGFTTTGTKLREEEKRDFESITSSSRHLVICFVRSTSSPSYERAATLQKPLHDLISRSTFLKGMWKPQSSPFFSSPTRSLTLKGKPHFADFILVPYKWGGFVNPWIDALAKARVGLEELRLKKMASS